MGVRNGVNSVSGKNKYFGTGETFLFKLQPNLAYYPWVGSPDSVKLTNGLSNQKRQSSQQNLAALANPLIDQSSNINQENINGNSNGNLSSLVNNNNVDMTAIKSIPANRQLFMCGERRYICIGSGEGNGLWIGDNLTRGRSEHCETFNNDPLVEKSDFICGNVELIGFK